MNKYYYTKVKGSYTIEAALILPFVLFIIIGLIYLGFYLHDYGKIKAIVDECQIRGKGLVMNEVDLNSGILSYPKYLDRSIFYPMDNDFKHKENQITNYIYKKTKDKLFISKVNNVETQVSAYNIKLRVDLDYQFPFGIIETFFKDTKKITIESNEKIHNPTEFIRGLQVSHDVAKKIDIVNKVTSKLKKIIGVIK